MSTPTDTTTSGIGGPCPTGHYCPQGTEDPIMCPNGTFYGSEMATEEGDCTTCSLGQYCGSPGLSNVTGPCDPGFYCLRGNSEPNPTGETFKKQVNLERI